MPLFGEYKPTETMGNGISIDLEMERISTAEVDL